jgi:hypothetical protein
LRKLRTLYRAGAAAAREHQLQGRDPPAQVLRHAYRAAIMEAQLQGRHRLSGLDASGIGV